MISVQMVLVEQGSSGPGVVVGCGVMVVTCAVATAYVAKAKSETALNIIVSDSFDDSKRKAGMHVRTQE